MPRSAATGPPWPCLVSTTCACVHLSPGPGFCPPRCCKPPPSPGRAAASPAEPDRRWPILDSARACQRPRMGLYVLARRSRAAVAMEHRRSASPLRHGDRARAAMSRSRHDLGAHPVHWQPTHTRTHALEFAPDQEGAARDPGVADTWDRAVSRSRKRRKRKRGGEENGPSSAQKAQEEEEPMKTFGPTTRVFLFFFFFTALTHGSHLSVRPAG